MVFLGWLLPAFGDATFWDKTYTKSGDNEVVEWFGVDYLDVRHTIRRLMGTQRLRPILNIGSGNSSFPGDLHDAGYRNVVSIDVSTVVLQQMAKRYSRKRELRWLCMDATNMAFDDEIFPLVIDKGTLDAIICTNNPEHWIKTYSKELCKNPIRSTKLCMTVAANHGAYRPFSMMLLLVPPNGGIFVLA